jgi:hypothetical protein
LKVGIWFAIALDSERRQKLGHSLLVCRGIAALLRLFNFDLFDLNDGDFPCLKWLLDLRYFGLRSCWFFDLLIALRPLNLHCFNRNLFWYAGFLWLVMKFWCHQRLFSDERRRNFLL